MARSRGTSQLAILAVLGLLLVTQCAARQLQQHRRVLLEDKAKASSPKTDSKAAAAKSSNSTKSTAQLADAAMLRTSIGTDEGTLLPQRDMELKADGTGRLGRVEETLLGQLNDLASRVPRVGAEATVKTAAVGNRTAQRRGSTVSLRTLPLTALAQGTGGAAAVDNGTAVTALDSTSNTVAKDIVGDQDSKSADLGGISRVQGITVTRGGRVGPGGSQVVGQATSDAGERSGDGTGRAAIFDGSSAVNDERQTALGDEVSTRLQVANLVSTTSPSGDGGPTNSGGSVIFAQADTQDLGGDYSVTNTRTFNKKFNTQAILTADARANRYKYTATSTGDIRAVGSKNAYAGIESGQFGTGFQVGRTNVKASTPLVYHRPKHSSPKPGPREATPQPASG